MARIVIAARRGDCQRFVNFSSFIERRHAATSISPQVDAADRKPQRALPKCFPEEPQAVPHFAIC